jgi:putative membrane protein
MTEYEQRQIAEAIARAERRTDAELVTVLARRADDYAYCPCSGPPCWRWPSRAVALAAGRAGVRRLAGGAMLLFVGLCLLLRNPRLAGWLIPRSCAAGVLRACPAAVSRTQPAAHRRGCRGADLCQRGGAACGDPGRWGSNGTWMPRPARPSLPALPSRCARAGLQGFVECIEACGELLSEHVPPTHARNELPNRLVILD